MPPTLALPACVSRQAGAYGWDLPWLSGRWSSGWLEGLVMGAQGWGTSPESHSFGIGSKGGAGLQRLPSPHPSPLPSRCLESREEGAATPGSPQRGPEEEQDKAGPKTRPSPPSLAPGTGVTAHTGSDWLCPLLSQALRWVGQGGPPLGVGSHDRGVPTPSPPPLSPWDHVATGAG